MDNFFRNVPFEDALDIEQAARVIFELRENRAKVLGYYGAPDESDLLGRIADGELPEHPAYEHYLSAGILKRTRESLRSQLTSNLKQAIGPDSGSTAIGNEAELACHPVALKQGLEERFRDRLAGEIRLMQDAVVLQFDTGLFLELRVLSAWEYAFSWLWGEATLRIDTAPGKDSPGAGTSHFHDVDDQRRPDLITAPGKEPLSNIAALVDALLRDPLLETEALGSESKDM